jgi:1-deoxy-D-xylulose-5-phosphate reductoisomerase
MDCMKLFLEPGVDQRSQWQYGDQGIDAVQHSAVAGQQLAAVLDTGAALELGFDQVADDAGRGDHDQYTRQRDPATFDRITPDEACAHPNFAMGRKISVDSATMMNKALEVIEARWLFALTPEQIRVVIHPQQIVHSMVVCRDNSVLAQLGTPDMRVPIAYGLSFPERIESGAAQLDFTSLAALTFAAPDFKRYPGLALAWETLRSPEGSTTVLNAANETAVAAFLAGTIRFDQIHSVIAQALERIDVRAGHDSLEALLEIDNRARRQAAQFVKGLAP